MNTRTLALAALMTLFLSGAAAGQSLSLDHVDGLNGTGGLETGVPVTLYIRVTGDNDAHGGVTNGFVVSSPTGAAWSATVGDTVGTLGKTQFDGGFFISFFSDDGMGADTVGFGGFRFFAQGLPAAFDDIAYTIEIGPIDAAYNGGEICLDSAFYPPSGVWKWAGPDVFPSWDGPHCWAIGEVVVNPEITCPGDTSLFLCETGTICFPFDTSDAETVTASPPAYIDGDQVCLPVEQSDEFTITLIAATDDVADSCSFTVTATLNSPPTVSMVPDSIDYVMCDLNGTICMAFGLSDPDDNIVDTAVNIGYVYVSEIGPYACFVPDTAGLFEITVTATDACGEVASTTRRVNVIAGESAAIECPDVVTDTLCGGGSYCVPLVITPDTARVSVSPSGVYDPETGQLCVNIEESGVHEFQVIAEAKCGADTCTVQLDMTVIALPIIDCPSQSPNLFIPDPGEVCIDLAIDNADIVASSYGTWNNGQLCFQADTSGFYEIMVTASNDCGTDSCLLIPFVQVGQFEMTTIIDPDPMRMIDAYHVDPQFADVLLGNLTDGHTADDVDAATVMINGVIAPTATEILADYPGFVGEVLKITIPVYDFIEYYMPLYDTSQVAYTVTGQFVDTAPLSEAGQVRLIGLLVGDANLDGEIDISDVTFLIDYFFRYGPPPLRSETADLDRNGSLDISDLMVLIDYMFME